MRNQQLRIVEKTSEVGDEGTIGAAAEPTAYWSMLDRAIAQAWQSKLSDAVAIAL